MSRWDPGSVGVQASVARTTTSARTVPPRVTTEAGEPGRRSRTSECSKIADPATLDGIGQPAGQERRLQHCAVRGEGRAERAGGADQLVRLLGTEPAQILLVRPSARASSTSASARIAGLRCAPGRPCHPWRSGTRSPRWPRWRRRHRRSLPWPCAWRAWGRGRAAGPAHYPMWRTEPSTIRRSGPTRRSRLPRAR